MKLSDLYTKNRTFPWVSLAVIAGCILVTGIFLVAPDTYHALAWTNQPQYPWQYVSGAFLHGTPEGGISLALAHLLANSLMFLPYAIALEKLLGSRKFGTVFLVTWLGISAAFQVIVLLGVPEGERAFGNGLSGSSFAVTVVGAWVLYQMFLRDRRAFLRQPLAWVFLSGLLGEAALLMPAVAGVYSMYIHLTGVALGAVLTGVFHKDIRAGIGEHVQN